MLSTSYLMYYEVIVSMAKEIGLAKQYLHFAIVCH